MWNRFAWSMAWRHLRHNVGQTLLTVSIVAISVILLILLNTLTHGIQNRILGAVTESLPHIKVQQPEPMPIPAWNVPYWQQYKTLFVGDLIQQSQRQRKIEDWTQWIPKILQMDKNILGVSPAVESQAILFRGAQPRSVSVIGMVPRQYDQVISMQSKMVEGSFYDLKHGQIILGKMIGDEMALRLGDKIRMVTSDGKSASFTIVGFFRTGMRNMDRSVSFVNLRDAQSLFGFGSAVTAISIKLERIFEANDLADRMMYRIPYEIHSWMRDNKNMLIAMQSQATTFNLILLLTTIAAGFAIASILIMAVVSKLKELGILKAMGATRRQIILIFTWQGILTALLGALIGAGISIAAVQYLLTFETRDEAGYTQKVFSIVELNASIVLSAMGIAVLIGFLAAVYPAWRASRVNPIDVIRGV